MSSALQSFLLENTVENITLEVLVSERFKDKDGKLLKFKIRAMTGGEFADYQKECMTIGKKGRVDFNSKKFNEKVIINQCVEPNFKDAELLKKAGCPTPEDFLYKCMLAGEISELANQINTLSGFDQDMEELRAEAKNS